MVTEHDRWVLDVDVAAPSLEDNTADVDRLVGALRARLGAPDLRVDVELLRRTPTSLREWGHRARCVLFRDQGLWTLVGLAAPEGGAPPCGVAVDLGTTRIALRLVDLARGAALGDRHLDNPQVEVGPDILTRIHAAAKEGGLERLRRLVVDGLNEGVADLCRDARLDTDVVHLLSIAGNTTMTHLLLGLEPRWIIREPYTPAANRPGLLAARDLGIVAGAGAHAFVFPNAGSYFGGDVIAGVLYSGMTREASPAVLVDVGTNAEVVLGGSDWLLACAGAAGPALEGGVAEIGMTAEPGAIDRIRIDPETKEMEIRTIADAPPRGICGSGLIDLAAGLFLSGMIDERGQIVPEACAGRLEEDDDGPRLVVVPAERSATSRALTLDQRALVSLTKAKAAMYTILETITASVGLRLSDVARFYVAGAFGSVIDPESAIAIGMLPDLPRSAFVVLGNASLGGAAALLSSPDLLEDVGAIRDRVTYLELNVNQDFMNRFNAAQFYPHTNPELFPSARRRRGST